MTRTICLVALAAGCAGGGPRHPVFAVGSRLEVAPACTYEAPPTVAETTHGAPIMLVGEGQVTARCGATTQVIDVARPTAARIDVPAVWRRSSAEYLFYAFVPVAGARALDGVRKGGVSPVWSLGPDCAGVAEYAPWGGSAATGGAEVSRQLVRKGSGRCTLTASALGVTATRRVVVE